jgi:CheY-like chemotaxis protein
MDEHTLLICDDSDTVRDVLCTILGFEFNVIPASSGAETLKLCQNSFVDLILLDVQMPEMDGFETCRQLKADSKSSSLPVIFMTGSQGVGSKVQGFEVGGVDFVDKPEKEEDFAEITARIRTHLTIREQRRKLEAQNREIHKAQERLIVQEKLASLGQFTAGVAHEIKNPLNFVVNFSQSIGELIDDLKFQLAKPEEKRDQEEIDYILNELPDTARDIKANGDRAVRIINGMLEHSRGERGTRREIDLNVLMEEYVNLAYHGMRSHNKDFNTHIRYDFDPDLNSQKIWYYCGHIFIIMLSIYLYKKIQSSAQYTIQCKKS